MFSEIADCFVHLDALLSDNAKVRLAIASKSHLKFLQKFLYHTCISINSIHQLPYFDRFTVVIVDSHTQIVPNNVKHIRYNQRRDDICFPILTTTNGLIKNINEVFVFSGKIKIPDEIERVTFLAGFEEGFDDLFLPSNMKYFDTGPTFNKSIVGCVPEGLKEMRLWCTNQLTKDMIPDSVVNLLFGPMFNQPVKGYLPSKLEVLKFDGCFDQPLRDCLPNTLKKLTVGGQYINSIDGCIPDSVIELHFSACFNRPVSAQTFPPYLEVLTFGIMFSHPIENYIPKTVKHLDLGGKFNESIKHLPDLEYLSLGFEFDRPIKDYIPKTVKMLKFGRKFDQSIKGSIPSGVTYLSFDQRFDQSIEDSIPSAVTYLSFGGRFNQPIKGHIPVSVKILYLGCGNREINSFNQSIEGAIPSSVEELRLGYNFCQPIKNYIPTSVQVLFFYGKINPHIEEYIEKYISDSVKILYVGGVFIRKQ